MWVDKYLMTNKDLWPLLPWNTKATLLLGSLTELTNMFIVFSHCDSLMGKTNVCSTWQQWEKSIFVIRARHLKILTNCLQKKSNLLPKANKTFLKICSFAATAKKVQNRKMHDWRHENLQYCTSPKAKIAGQQNGSSFQYLCVLISYEDSHTNLSYNVINISCNDGNSITSPSLVLLLMPFAHPSFIFESRRRPLLTN